MPPTAAAHLVAAVLAAVLPGRCPGCDGPGEPVCAGCAGDLVPAGAVDAPPGVERCVAVLSYEGVGRELVARAKYRGHHAALGWLAASMAEAWRAGAGERPDVVTWVPTAPARRRARGIDHARVLARGVARHLDRPAVRLLRRGPGAPQTERTAAERRAGPIVVANRAVAGTILLVDDVMTTGATVRACADALGAAGATRVLALTAARTPTGRAGRGGGCQIVANP